MSVAGPKRGVIEIADEISSLMDHIDAADGELDENAEDELDTLVQTLGQKAEAYSFVCRQLEADAEACKTVAEEYTGRAARKLKRVAWLKQRLFSAMQLAGVAVAEGPTGGARIQPSPPKLELLVSEDKLPDQYIEIVRKPRRAELLRAIRDHEPDAMRLGKLTQTHHLRWK